MLRPGLCWTAPDHVRPVAPVLAASEGLPDKKEGLGSDGLKPGKQNLDRLGILQGSWARAIKVGTGLHPPPLGPYYPHIPLVLPTFLR